MTSENYGLVTITSVKKLANSTNGNPAWGLTFQNEKFPNVYAQTKTDAACGYVITHSLVGNKCKIHLDEKGRISNVLLLTRAEKLMDKMLSIYKYIVLTADTCQEYIEHGGQVDCVEFKKWLVTNGYWREYYE